MVKRFAEAIFEMDYEWLQHIFGHVQKDQLGPIGETLWMVGPRPKTILIANQ